MKSILMPAALAIALAAGLTSGPIQAAGCLKGAAVGGVAGHLAGHHGLLGAGAGCVIGRHEANKHARDTLSASLGPRCSKRTRVAQLHAEQRQVILLVGLEGMSYQDAAGIRGTPIGTHSLLAPVPQPRLYFASFLDMEERRSSAALPRAA